jgi:hypothetical protein
MPANSTMRVPANGPVARTELCEAGLSSMGLCLQRFLIEIVSPCAGTGKWHLRPKSKTARNHARRLP